MEDILKTCLHQKHLDLGAKMMPFGGFDMPIEYTTIIEEHNAVRHAAGIFRDLFCQRVERIGIQRFLHLFLQNLLIVHLRFLFAHFMRAIFFMLKTGFAASKRLYQRIQQLHQ